MWEFHARIPLAAWTCLGKMHDVSLYMVVAWQDAMMQETRVHIL